MRRKIKKEKEKDEIAKKIVAIGKHFIRIQNSVIAKCFEISALKYGCLLVISTRSSCGHRVFLLPVFPPILSCSESYSSGVIKAKRQSAGASITVQRKEILDSLCPPPRETNYKEGSAVSRAS